MPLNPRIGPPPGPATPAEEPLYRWNLRVMETLNALPELSVFSFSTPESNVTATQGTIGINVLSTETSPWYKLTGSGNTGWVRLRT